MGFFSRRTALKVVELPIQKILPNPNQPRKSFDSDSLRQLAQSIEQNGLLQPITVRAISDGYELIAGERRLRAFGLLGREVIPAIVWSADEQQSSVLALLENIQRQNLSYFEEAVSYQQLLNLQGISQQRLAEQLGKNQSTIANKLRLLRFSPEMMEKILACELTERHARALLKIADLPQCEQVIDYIAGHSLNVAQTERYIESILQGKPTRRGKTTWLVQDVRIFANSIQRAIDVMKNAGICAVSSQKEDEHSLTYIVTIPKTAALRKPKDSGRMSG